MIKFRGKANMPIEELDEIHIEHNSGWVYGNLILNGNQPFIVGNVADSTDEYIALEFWVPVIPESVGQFTGLHDVKGKEIYERDIVKKSNDFSISIGRAIFSDGAFRLQFNYSWGMSIRSFSAEDAIKDMGASTTLKNTYEIVGVAFDEELKYL